MINNISNNNTIIKYIFTNFKAYAIDYVSDKNQLSYNKYIINLAI